MPNPSKGESRVAFINRCIPYLHKEDAKRSNDQCVAICFSLWRQHKKKAK